MSKKIARIALYNRLFARSIVTRRRGVGGVLLPWGKGLNIPSMYATFSLSPSPVVTSRVPNSLQHVINSRYTNTRGPIFRRFHGMP